MQDFLEEDFYDLRSLNLTDVQKDKLLEVAEKVKRAEQARKGLRKKRPDPRKNPRKK
jgi:hypothetical protein